MKSKLLFLYGNNIIYNYYFLMFYFNVSGFLPTQIGNLNKLTDLYIEENSFSGKILFILNTIYTDKTKIILL